jgi:periplasmic protein TonB
VGVLVGSDVEPSTPVGQAGRRSRNLSLVLSTAIHAALLLVLCWRVAPIFVKPELLARGNGGTSTRVSVQLYLPQDTAPAAAAMPAIVSFPVPTHQRIAKSRPRKRHNALSREEEKDDTEAGSRFGTSLDGPTEGEEIRPGFAISFTDPRVSRWELPGGVQGEVIVELSIDAQGNVVEEKLLQGLGHGVDEKIMATLRDWRFRPATRNGVAIPFKYDAHFHFPS